ncbi:hypothetical protein L9F63_019595 [Diploptera punctata]|uniref:Carboxypeptidase n=1 Tax=Diploptera punctata TaxID=6984 RepID=A0AAD7ZTY9_DIPPU|nr:hypothetical protein L9F63_019595 [Diploptera punctata]
MWWSGFLIILVIWEAKSIENPLGDAYPLKSSLPVVGDVGKRLILTPYIESGRIEEARNLSAVSGDPFPSDIPSYSGYLTVNKTYNSNLFFWYFPAENDYETAPLLLWLQGGPGSSSLFGLFTELGPFSVAKDNMHLVRNPYSWHKNHSIIFIDNPVGTGFSFTDNEAGYATDQVQVGDELYTAMCQFLTLFPELRKVPFYITGESYAGKYVPTLGYTIHQRNPTSKFKINLAGLAVGNGFTDPITLLDYSEFVYQLGLVDTNTFQIMRGMEDCGVEAIQDGKIAEAHPIWNAELNVFSAASHYSNIYNFLYPEAPKTGGDHTEFVQTTKVRKAIHVGDAEYSDSQFVYDKMRGDMMSSVRPQLEVLLDNYRVLYYNGQMDIIVAYPLSVRMYNTLEFRAAEEYRKAQRYAWKVDGELAGYMKSAGNFTEVLVRNAGHMVPTDQPKFAFDLINRFTSDNLISIYHLFKHPAKSTMEPDSRLILTPYIESGRIEEARSLSAVSGDPFPSDIPSYSGFLTVNKTYNSNLFFWYFPAENDYETAPLLLWLQGGPGSSSLFGLFTELGPFSVAKDNMQLVRNPYSWHKNHSIIFIDNPVGTGFSFTDDDAGYATNQVQVGDELYTAMSQFLTLFPELRKVPFYITGESYGGKYVPTLGYTIHQRNPTSKFKINLAGLAVGNGFTDPITLLDYSEFVYQLGLVDTNTFKIMKSMEDCGVEAIQDGKIAEAHPIWNAELNVFSTASHYSNVYNFLYPVVPKTGGDHTEFVQTTKVRKAIHVGDAEYSDFLYVYSKMKGDMMSSVRPQLEVLLDNYRVLYYNGQMDIIVAYPLSVRMYNTLEFRAAEEYRKAKRYAWKVDGELAGYMKSAGNFTEVLVRNAGHMVPTDQPKFAFDLINRFTSDNLVKSDDNN